MGLDQKDSISSYRSDNPLHKNPISLKMTLNRFELLLNRFHFFNKGIVKRNRQGKIQPLLNLLNRDFKSICTPGNVVINEILIPWHGRLKFCQFIPSNDHKYGIKLFKLFTEKFYIQSVHLFRKIRIRSKR